MNQTEILQHIPRAYYGWRLLKASTVNAIIHVLSSKPELPPSNLR